MVYFITMDLKALKKYGRTGAICRGTKWGLCCQFLCQSPCCCYIHLGPNNPQPFPGTLLVSSSLKPIVLAAVAFCHWVHPFTSAVPLGSQRSCLLGLIGLVWCNQTGIQILVTHSGSTDQLLPNPHRSTHDLSQVSAFPFSS
jgi:hypothetical protein